MAEAGYGESNGLNRGSLWLYGGTLRNKVYPVNKRHAPLNSPYMKFSLSEAAASVTCNPPRFWINYSRLGTSTGRVNSISIGISTVTYSSTSAPLPTSVSTMRVYDRSGRPFRTFTIRSWITSSISPFEMNSEMGIWKAWNRAFSFSRNPEKTPLFS